MNKINAYDIFKGFLVAVLTALITGCYNAIQNGGLDLTWLFFKPILLYSFGAGLAYLLKNLFLIPGGSLSTSLFKINVADVLKGFLVAVLTALITCLYNAIQEGTILFTWVFFRPIVLYSIGAGLAYLIKNVFSNSQDKVLTAEPKYKAPDKEDY
ncbi:MAG TPA: hypothetical protein P5531_10575 [Bacteroidales bacterium]|nr:hypothetical protein [Bacteroidales bacterium]HSA43593.1 hypothetical protein [Bacteroidales bacterium]